MKKLEMNKGEKVAFFVIKWGAVIFTIGLLIAGFKWLISVIF